jgi:Cell division protein CrgA
MAYDSKRFTPKKAADAAGAAGAADALESAAASATNAVDSNATAAVTAAKAKLANSSLGKAAAAAAAADSAKAGGKPAEKPGRYTPRPIPTDAEAVAPDSPAWVTYLMFALFAIGLLVIVLNYTNIWWATNNKALLIGLGVIVAGFITATKVR